MKRTWMIAAALVVVVALAAAGILLRPGDRGPVLTCGDYALDNTTLAYYYWSEYFYFAEAYGDYLEGTVDFSQPLKKQPYDDTMSWEDYLLEETLNTVRDTMVMVFAAEEAGFVLPAEYDTALQQVLLNFSVAAQEAGYQSLEAYLRASYGKGAETDSFETYLYQSHLAAAYADHLLEQCLPTDQEARDYFSQRQSEYVEFYDADPADESTWLEQARADLQQETYQNTFLTIRSQYTFLVNADNAVLKPPSGLYT